MLPFLLQATQPPLPPITATHASQLHAAAGGCGPDAAAAASAAGRERASSWTNRTTSALDRSALVSHLLTTCWATASASRPVAAASFRICTPAGHLSMPTPPHSSCAHQQDAMGNNRCVRGWGMWQGLLTRTNSSLVVMSPMGWAAAAAAGPGLAWRKGCA